MAEDLSHVDPFSDHHAPFYAPVIFSRVTNGKFQDTAMTLFFTEGIASQEFRMVKINELEIE